MTLGSPLFRWGKQSRSNQEGQKRPEVCEALALHSTGLEPVNNPSRFLLLAPLKAQEAKAESTLPRVLYTTPASHPTLAADLVPG